MKTKKNNENREAALNIVADLITGAALPKVIREMSETDISRYVIRADRLPKGFDGFKIVHLSDLHNKSYGKYDIELFKMVAEEDPDIVVMTGDMISHAAENLHDFISFVRLTADRYPLYYVNGNHELSDINPQTFSHLAETFRLAGAECLDNACTTIARGNDKITLCGLCYPAVYYRGVREHKLNWSCFSLKDMESYVGKKSSESFTILLAHNPLDFDVHAQWGADISFGGHIHGGFIRVPFFKGIISPELRLFPKYKEGVYKKGSSILVVSRGLGRIRFFNPPELVSVTLKCPHNSKNNAASK